MTLTIRFIQISLTNAECQCHNGLRARPHNHTLDPQAYECIKWSKCCHNVRVICSGLFDHCSQLAVKGGDDEKVEEENHK
jgi:hypothetical protein